MTRTCSAPRAGGRVVPPGVLLTRRAEVMGSLVNRPVTTAAAGVAAAVVIALNASLLWGLAVG